MTTPPSPSAPSRSGDDRNLVPAASSSEGLGFEDRLQMFWMKNKQSVLIALVAVVLVIVGKGAWEYYSEQKEIDEQKAFAAANTPEKLKAFAAAHADHVLAGVAHLTLADQAYAAGRSAEATAAYTQALTRLPAGPLASRAKLGLAMASIQSGKTADGENSLKQLLADTSLPAGVRCEAAFHLASLAHAQGKDADAKKYCQQIAQLDSDSAWNRRAAMLVATLAPGA